MFGWGERSGGVRGGHAGFPGPDGRAQEHLPAPDPDGPRLERALQAPRQLHHPQRERHRNLTSPAP
ncbi:predicted protein [Streptomyces albidoflavus]|nr:predicted protein [Streptomyces albidoflavus]